MERKRRPGRRSPEETGALVILCVLLFLVALLLSPLILRDIVHLLSEA